MGKWGFFKGSRDNWFSHELYNWMDSSRFPQAAQLHERCKAERIREALSSFTDMYLQTIEYYPDGTFQEEGKPLLDNVQAFYLVRLKEFLSGRHIADHKIFLPLRWNHRFMGIAGAGTNMETDWDKEQTTNLTSWPMAVRNGFACVVSNGATGMFVDSSWGFKDQGLDWEMINNWAFTGTHNMTVCAKAVVEAAYGEKICKSYMHGTSGGGRQIMCQAQLYPEDYDGLWADGPLFDFYNMMFSCLWAAVVYYNESNRVPLEKFITANKLTRTAKRVSMGPFDLKSMGWLNYLRALPGTPTPAGPITIFDLQVMLKVWNGPVLSDGTRISYGFGPEITQWPVGPRKFGYLKRHEDGTITVIPFALQFLRWLVRDPDWDIRTCSYKEFEKIYLDHKKEFEKFAFYDPDLRPLAKCGGKLLITHGTGDHIAPHQVSFDYYKKTLQYFSSEQELNKTFRVFFPPEGGHALYDWDGPNVTNESGWKALMNWVENDQPPEQLRAVNYDFSEDKLIKDTTVPVFNLWQWKKHYGK